MWKPKCYPRLLCSVKTAATECFPRLLCSVKTAATECYPRLLCSVKTAATECYPRLSCSVKTAATECYPRLLCSVKTAATECYPRLLCSVKTAATECYPRLLCSVKTAVIRWLWKSCHVSSAQTMKDFATQKNYKYKRMKHGKQRAIGKIAFNNQQNSLLKPLVIPDWLVSDAGAKVTCVAFSFKILCLKQTDWGFRKTQEKTCSIKKDGMLSSNQKKGKHIFRSEHIRFTVIALDYICLGLNLIVLYSQGNRWHISGLVAWTLRL